MHRSTSVDQLPYPPSTNQIMKKTGTSRCTSPISRHITSGMMETTERPNKSKLQHHTVPRSGCNHIGKTSTEPEELKEGAVPSAMACPHRLCRSIYPSQSISLLRIPPSVLKAGNDNGMLKDWIWEHYDDEIRKALTIKTPSSSCLSERKDEDNDNEKTATSPTVATSERAVAATASMSVLPQQVQG